MKVEIREAGPEDAGAIMRLVHELARIEGVPSTLTTDYVAVYLSAPGACVLLAETGGRALGLISYYVRPNLYHAGDCCLIDELVVDERARGQGIGGALLDAVVDRARAAGCAEVSLSTMPDNARAIAFYRRHGFTDEAVALERHFVGQRSVGD